MTLVAGICLLLVILGIERYWNLNKTPNQEDTDF